METQRLGDGAGNPQLLSKIVVLLFNASKLSVAEFLELLGPSTVYRSKRAFPDACTLYLEILRLEFHIKSKLIHSMCPKYSYEFWARVLFDPTDFGQLACFNILMNGVFNRKQAIIGSARYNFIVFSLTISF